MTGHTEDCATLLESVGATEEKIEMHCHIILVQIRLSTAQYNKMICSFILSTTANIYFRKVGLAVLWTTTFPF